jgi:hypothetical protein
MKTPTYPASEAKLIAFFGRFVRMKITLQAPPWPLVSAISSMYVNETNKRGIIRRAAARIFLVQRFNQVTALE